jgi:hypothetical protein
VWDIFKRNVHLILKKFRKKVPSLHIAKISIKMLVISWSDDVPYADLLKHYHCPEIETTLGKNYARKIGLRAGQVVT